MTVCWTDGRSGLWTLMHRQISSPFYGFHFRWILSSGLTHPPEWSTSTHSPSTPRSIQWLKFPRAINYWVHKSRSLDIGKERESRWRKMEPLTPPEPPSPYPPGWLAGGVINCVCHTCWMGSFTLSTAVNWLAGSDSHAGILSVSRTSSGRATDPTNPRSPNLENE